MKAFLHTYGASILTGVLLFLAFPATNWHYLAWVALVPLLNHVRDLSPMKTAGAFFLAGWVFHSLLLQWLAANIFWAGGWAIWGYQGLCVFMAAYWALLGFSWKVISRRLPQLGKIIPFIILWSTMEFLQSIVFTGFGWGVLAHSQSYNLYALQWGSLGGYVLIGLFIVTVNIALSEMILDKSNRFRHLCIAMTLLLAIHAGGYFMQRPTSYSDTPIQLGVYQSNTPIQTKWDTEFTDALINQALVKSRILADEDPIDLFVWPEALIVSDIRSDVLQQSITSLLKDTQADLFTGAQRREGKYYYNSSYLISSDGDFSNYYDKIHLAPYGEYVPFANYLPFLSNILPSMSDQTPGESQEVFETHGRNLGPLICFEVLFSPMSQHLRAEGADFLVVVTNMAWFGSSNALSQELAVAKLRAVETRLPLVQSANTGFSGVIDPYGRFSAVNRYIDQYGNIFALKDEVPPEGTSHQRLIGRIPLPEAANQPIANGPLYFPCIISTLCCILLVMACVGGKTGTPGKKKAS